MNTKTFPCGCVFNLYENGNIIYDFDNIPLDCKATWELIGSGRTKGVFQLETNLGKSWAKRLKPEHIEHLAALGAILRPGSLKSLDEKGISTTEHYCRRKNGEEPIELKYKELADILKDTFGVIIYQEESIQIVSTIAKFSEVEADKLRKAMGKKLTEEMVKVKNLFLEKGKEAGILPIEALSEIFDWIQKSERYSFNHSHSVGYGLSGYDSAYVKAHSPLTFYTSYLYHAKHEQKQFDEIRELVQDAKQMNITIRTNDIRLKNENFTTDGKDVFFGISNIRGIGTSASVTILEIASQCDFNKTSWLELLIKFSTIGSYFEKLVKAGCFDFTGLHRRQMLFEISCLEKLTEQELEWVKCNYTRYNNLTETLDGAARLKHRKTKAMKEIGALLETKNTQVSEIEYGAAANKNRIAAIRSIIELIAKPPSSLVDDEEFIADNEEYLLGVALTCSRVDGKNFSSNCLCREFSSFREKIVVLAVELQAVKVIKIKNGQSCGRQMAFLTAADNSGVLEDITVFPDTLDKTKKLLQIGNTVLLKGKRDYKRGCMIVDEAYQI